MLPCLLNDIIKLIDLDYLKLNTFYIISKHKVKVLKFFKY
jgi:hypothetical protein